MGSERNHQYEKIQLADCKREEPMPDFAGTAHRGRALPDRTGKTDRAFSQHHHGAGGRAAGRGHRAGKRPARRYGRAQPCRTDHLPGLRVVVVDIGRSHAVLYLYDMALQCVFRTVLPDHGGDGNELLTSISDAVFQGFSMEELHAGKMKSIGLLFQDDTEISEFRVMYSTGYTAATISLREALFTQFKVPIVEEYSRVYTVSRALAEAGKSVGSNYAHIDLGDRAVVQIVQKEQPVSLRSDGQADITGLLLPGGGSLLELAQNFEAASPAQQAAALKNTQSPVSCFTVRLSNVARMLCSLFVIEKLYLSGPAAASPAFMRGVVQKLKSPEVRPVVLNPDPAHTPAFMATDLRQSLLCSTDA